MKQLILVSLLMGFVTVFSAAQTPQLIQNGFSVEREIGGIEKHIYEGNLAKEQILHLVVEQRGVDVVVRVFTADGKLFDRIDSANGTQGVEPISFVSLMPATYRFEISGLFENGPRGRYFIKPLEIRKATGREVKLARLKNELMKIVVADNNVESSLETRRRIYTDKATFVNPYGGVLSIAEILDYQAKNPFNPPEGFSTEVELSDARLQDNGDFVTMQVRQSRHSQNPNVNLDRTVVQLVGYVFKKMKGSWRIVNVQRTFLERTRKPVRHIIQQLDALTGVYEGGNPLQTLTVTRENNAIYAKLAETEKFELIPESESAFYAPDGFISVAFIRSDNGLIVAVVHYPMPEDKMTIMRKIK